MGQQETTVAASSALRRIVLALLVAALMAATMAANALPAMAKNSGDQGPGRPPTQSGGGPKSDPSNTDVFHCQAFGGTGVFVDGPVRDISNGC